ncbi:SDR family oxidoreductase [Flammeovirga yaeyamensis]|uniref:SDR family oxidoreductase n=2 Tax=Flammeovirga yaeyamensis TaxID=367791 RepID=A0AAX1N990_9BACT|nr:SDR family oxidoreductase [Flammeovirga yaeyamensis]QWG04015.1 SDR family oxidoreductase [Flammeovirga yaeyamensis]
MNNTFADLKNKVTVITGGAGVLGNSICNAFASCGSKLAIVDLNLENAEKLANQLVSDYNIEAIGVSANVLNKESLKEAKTKINNQLGAIEILVNGAGGNHPKATTSVEQMVSDEIEGSFFDLDIEGFDFVFDLNFKGTLLPSMIFGKDMIGKENKGVILNISSMNAFKPLTKIPAYSAAKSSINNFTEWLATHLAPQNIRVNSLAPGFFITDQNRFLVTNQDGSFTERGQKIVNGTPMNKFGKPDDIQGTSLYLCSDISSFVTGICIPVDGGYNCFSGV